jgi:TonB-dependent receptor
MIKGILRAITLLLLVFSAATARAQGTAIVRGKVTDMQSGDPMPGVSVTLKGTGKGVATDLKGEFVLSFAKTGSNTLEFSYLGYEDKIETVTVGNGAAAPYVRVQMKPAGNKSLKEVVVVGTQREGQAKALNQQRTADNIKNIVSADLIGRFPDVNIADALQRVPGVNVERDRGEGGVIQMRGAPPGFTTVNINGEQIPGTQSEGQRNQEMSIMPVDQLSSIEVSKAITPDQDGDNIAGTVDLKTPVAKSLKGRGKVEIGGGYGNIVQTTNFIGRASYNKRFFKTEQAKDGWLGLNGSISFLQNNNGRDRTQYEYFSQYANIARSPGDTARFVVPSMYRMRDLLTTRQRIGGAATIDIKPNARNEWVLNYMYSERDDTDAERHFRMDFSGANNFGFANGDFSQPGVHNSTRIRRFVNNRRSTVKTNTFSLNGRNQLGKVDLDYTAFYSLGKNAESVGTRPDFRSANYVADLTNFYTDRFQPSFRGVDIFDPFIINSLNSYRREATYIDADNLAFKFNASMPYKIKQASGIVKVGGKIRRMTSERDRRNQIYRYNAASGINQANLFATYLSRDEDQQFLKGQVRFGPTMDGDAFDRFVNANPNLITFDQDQSDLENFPAYYNSTEDVMAGYAMTKLNIKKWMFLAGLRYEGTSVNYEAYKFDRTPSNLILPGSLRLVEGNTDYGFLLPNLHIRYSVNKRTNVRLAYTESFARSNYIDLAPFEQISIQSQNINRGNPALLPARSRNADLMFEHFLDNIGIISAGVFYKNIRNFNYNFFFSEDRQVQFTRPDGSIYDSTLTFAVEQPRNGDVANLFGFEVNLQSNLTFLPGALKGIGVYFNYTFTHSSASTPTRKDVQLVGQAAHTWNAAISWDYKGFTARAMYNFSGGSPRGYGPLGIVNSDDFDIYRANRSQLDFSAAYQITKRFRVYGELLNITNRPDVEYIGQRNRPLNIEYYDWWSRFGIAYTF